MNLEDEIILKLDSEEWTPLRQVQEEALTNNSSYTLPGVRRVTSRLSQNLLTEKRKEGRSYLIRLTSDGHRRQRDLLEGSEAPSEALIPDMGIQLPVRVSRAVWGRLMDEVKSRELSTVFVPPDTEVYIKKGDQPLCRVPILTN